MLDIIAAHYMRYKNMQTADILKLIYQNEFGCGHLIADKNAAHVRFVKEWDSADAAPGILLEDIGNGFCRINIAAAKNLGLFKTPAFESFYRSASLKCGSPEAFLEKANAAASLCGSILHHDRNELIAMAKECVNNGCPPFSHSEIYRKNYSPAYRVAAKCFCTSLLNRR